MSKWREQVPQTLGSMVEGSPQNMRDGHQQHSTPTSQLRGTQRISQEQQSASGAPMTVATGAGERRFCLSPSC